MSKPDIRGRLEADPVYWIDMEYAAKKYLREHPDDDLNRPYVQARTLMANRKIIEFMHAGTLTQAQLNAELALQAEYNKP